MWFSVDSASHATLVSTGDFQRLEYITNPARNLTATPPRGLCGGHCLGETKRTNQKGNLMTPHTFSASDSRALQARATAVRAEKAQQWAELDLRQTFADEAFMRAHLRAAGLRINNSNEPATVPRLAVLLRRAGVEGQEVVQSIGPFWQTAAGRSMGRDAVLFKFLTMNPRLPLWAAVALVLELTGRFTADAFAHMGRQTAEGATVH
jgi:hypothetical protein